ncbi:MAG: VOC family protein [Rhodobiaceae bacterium]|nr:VOC family protein [Rhodobiaceae bacterium]
MAERGFKVRALGEIAIRTANLEAMVAFYRDTIGLEVLAGNYSDGIVFFRIAEGFGGHTSVLALFDANAGRPELAPSDAPVAGGAGSTLHHIALSLPFEEQDAVRAWYDSRGIVYRVQEFGWIGWRGIFTTDPDGNTVELVAYDPSMLDPAG